MKDVIFNVFVLMTLIPSLWVALSSNLVHAAFSLLFTFFGIAGLYVLLGADFIGVVQVIIYIGGILVLIVFGVMMTERGRMLHLSVQLPGRLLASILSLIMLGALCLAFTSARWPVAPFPGEPEPTTLDESVAPGYDVRQWAGLMAPAKTPPEILSRLTDEAGKALAAPVTRQRFDDLGFDVSGISGAEFQGYLRGDRARWSKIITDRKLQLD